jgi:CRP-like cAMP-binding protein
MSVPANHNRLLALLPEEDYRDLVTQAETVSLRQLAEVYPADGPIDSVYFPLTMVASVLTGSGRSREVEMAIIGNEGMLGSSVILGIPRSFGRTLVQVAGTALKLRINLLYAYIERRPVLRTLLMRYLRALIRHVMQAGACNLLHNMQERCARWLLLMRDCIGQDTFLLTQQILADMIGVRRATVNLALGIFKRTGLISYTRGRIQILDRAGLEAVSCPCYTSIAVEYQRLRSDMTLPNSLCTESFI